MSNKRKLNQPVGRTLQHRQGRGRHREPGTIAGLVALPGQAGVKILAAGALGSAAMMMMQPGAAAVAGGTATAPGVTGATLTANLSASQVQSAANHAQSTGGQAQNTGGGISTNPADLLGLPALGPSPLPQASPGNPSVGFNFTVPLSPNGDLGTPSVGIQGSVSPANVNNDSLFGLGPKNSVGGAIPFSLNSSMFGQSPAATQPTFTMPTTDQIIANDPVLKGLINTLTQTQTPTFDLPQLPTLQDVFPNAATGANSLNSITPGEETALQQQINQAFGAPQGQDGVLTPQQLIDQAFGAFPAQTAQQPAPGQQLTPQQLIDQAFSTLQAQNGQTPISDFGSLLGASPAVTGSRSGSTDVRSSNDLGNLVQLANLPDPANPLASSSAPGPSLVPSVPLQVVPNPGVEGGFGITKDPNTGANVIMFTPTDGSPQTIFQPGDAVALPDGINAFQIKEDTNGNPFLIMTPIQKIPTPSNFGFPAADNGTNGQQQVVADASLPASPGDNPSAPSTPVTRSLVSPSQDQQPPAQDQPPAPVPVVQDQPPAPVPVVQDQPPAPVPVAQDQPPAPVPVVQDQQDNTTLQGTQFTSAGDSLGSGGTFGGGYYG